MPYHKTIQARVAPSAHSHLEHRHAAASWVECQALGSVLGPWQVRAAAVEQAPSRHAHAKVCHQQHREAIGAPAAVGERVNARRLACCCMAPSSNMQAAHRSQHIEPPRASPAAVRDASGALVNFAGVVSILQRPDLHCRAVIEAAQHVARVGGPLQAVDLVQAGVDLRSSEGGCLRTGCSVSR